MRRIAWAAGVAVLLCVPGVGGAQPVPPQGVQPATAGSLPEVIPIFPLEDAMLFPSGSRPLLIFEARYRAMVADALRGDRVIGMVMLKPGFEADYAGRPPIHAIGCAGLITRSEQLPDGRYTILLKGLVKFRVTDENLDRPYRLARVEALPEVLTDDERAALRSLRPALDSAIDRSLSAGVRRPAATVTDEDLVNAAAQQLHLDPDQRQGLLEQRGALSRAKALIGLLDK